MDLIELHILQSFPVTCLNRDDLGAPKSAVFGGCPRARISSQCWKREIRTLCKTASPDFFAGSRTRLLKKSLSAKMVEKNIEQEKADKIAHALTEHFVGIDKNKPEKSKILLYFSPLQIENVINKVIKDNLLSKLENEKELAKAAKSYSKRMSETTNDMADIAIFGRMVADDHSLMLEGAGLFSHALSTHTTVNDIDYFSAVDDLDTESQGAGHIGTLEYNSACYYRYIGLNLGLLKDENHLGHIEPQIFHQILRTFIESCIIAVPNARKNSMLGHNLPVYILGLCRTGQPLSLVNAFEKPVESKNGFIGPSIETLERHWENLKKLYALDENIKSASKLPPDDIEKLIEKVTKENRNEN